MKKINRRLALTGAALAATPSIAAQPNDIPANRPTENTRRLLADVLRFLERCPDDFVPTVEFGRIWCYAADDLVEGAPSKVNVFIDRQADIRFLRGLLAASA